MKTPPPPDDESDELYDVADEEYASPAQKRRDARKIILAGLTCVVLSFVICWCFLQEKSWHDKTEYQLAHFTQVATVALQQRAESKKGHVLVYGTWHYLDASMDDAKIAAFISGASLPTNDTVKVYSASEIVNGKWPEFGYIDGDPRWILKTAAARAGVTNGTFIDIEAAPGDRVPGSY